MVTKGAKEIPRCFCSKPATFQHSTVIADIISHSLLSFPENFSHDPKEWKLLKMRKVFQGVPKIICKIYSLAGSFKTSNPLIFKNTQIQSLVVSTMILPSNATHYDRAFECHMQYCRMFLNGSILDLMTKESITT